MLKKMLLKKLIKSKMGAEVPDEELDKIIMLVEKNPELFKKIGDEIQEKVNAGQDQQMATLTVMQAHKEELQKIYQSS